MSELYRSLEHSQVSFEKTTQHSVQCQKGNSAFTVELNHLEDLTNILIIKFKRVSGDMPSYRDVSSKILSGMTLV